MVALVRSVEETRVPAGHGRGTEKYDSNLRMERNAGSMDREETLVLERRIFGRRRVNVTADARRLDHTVAARREPRVKLMVKDLSLGGLAAVSATKVECGEFVGVTFPPELGQRGWNAFGRVIRCEAGDEGYHVAVEFEALPAA